MAAETSRRQFLAGLVKPENMAKAWSLFGGGMAELWGGKGKTDSDADAAGRDLTRYDAAPAPRPSLPTPRPEAPRAPAPDCSDERSLVQRIRELRRPIHGTDSQRLP